MIKRLWRWLFGQQITFVEPIEGEFELSYLRMIPGTQDWELIKKKINANSIERARTEARKSIKNEPEGTLISELMLVQISPIMYGGEF